MLSVLAFKKSLFAGVLDGGEHEVFMQGTRLSKFMESVEQVAGAIGDADTDAEVSPVLNAAQAEPVQPTSPLTEATAPAPQDLATEKQASAGDAPDPWAAILEAGAALLQGLAASRGASGGAGAPPMAIERDPVTGQTSLRVPLPDPAVLQRLAKAFEPWLR